MAIRLKRLPKRDDYNGRYEYQGHDARYETERFGSLWRIKIEGHDGSNDYEQGLESYNEVRAFIESYAADEGDIGTHARWESGYDAALLIRYEKLDQRAEAIRREVDDILGR